MNAENSAVGAEMLEAEMNSTAIVLGSDCGRGVGLPALYRAGIGQSNLP
jgi:hypothetical protein